MKKNKTAKLANTYNPIEGTSAAAAAEAHAKAETLLETMRRAMTKGEEFKTGALGELEEAEAAAQRKFRSAYEELQPCAKEFFDSFMLGYRLPALPAFGNAAAWSDSSWHNDENPGWYNEAAGLQLYCSLVSPITGKCDEGYKKYHLMAMDVNHSYLYDIAATDDKAEIEAVIKKWNGRKAPKLTEGFGESDVQMIATAFTKGLRKYLTAQQFKEMQRRNAAEMETNCCHSHDFCDANVLMAEAVKKVTGRDISTAKWLNDDGMLALWGAAWDCAIAQNFSAK